MTWCIWCLPFLTAWDTSSHRPAHLWHWAGTTAMRLELTATKVEMAKACCGLGPLWQAPESWPSWAQRTLLWTLIIKPRLLGCQTHMGTWTFWLVETRESIFTGHRAKLSRHRPRQKGNLAWFLYARSQLQLSLSLSEPSGHLGGMAGDPVVVYRVPCFRDFIEVGPSNLFCDQLTLSHRIFELGGEPSNL